MTAALREGPGRPRRWFREPYVWLLITFPALAVVGGVATITIALLSDDGLVVDDYYQQGKNINRLLQRDQVASRLGLQATLRFHDDGLITVMLDSREPHAADASVTLSMSYATRSGHDQTIELQRSGDAAYLGRLQPLRKGKWYVQLRTDDWRLLHELQSPPAPLHTLRAGPDTP